LALGDRFLKKMLQEAMIYISQLRYLSSPLGRFLMEITKMIKRLEGYVFGRVQMVMFRDFTCRKARSLGLVGTVKNLAEGSVLAVAEGEEEKLQEWLKKIKKGPMLAHVERVEEKWSAATGEFSDFKIIY
jgi:acylphosphatase